MNNGGLKMDTEKQIINDNIFKIISSNYFRQLKDKTQLFSAGNYECYRNRLTHSLEVKNIAFEIARGLETEFSRIEYNCNFDLIEAISLAHDIGHTPFGHIGERTLQKIMTREDCLGGMLCIKNEKLFFKHNVNSIRILINNISKVHWKILDGVVKHTSVKYKNQEYKDISNGIGLISKNEKDSLYSLNSNYNDYIKEKVDIALKTTYDNLGFALTIEGQIVAMADEIAQRIADFDDTYKSRYAFQVLNEIEELSFIKESKSFADVILSIKNLLIKKLCVEITKKHNLENYSKECVICFNEIKKFKEKKSQKISFTKEDLKSGEYINYKISTFIDEVVTKSEYVREMDAKANFIIRQLFKAYFNNFEQLPDSTLRVLIQDVSDFLHNNLKYDYIKRIIKTRCIDLSNSSDYKKDIQNIFYLNKFNIKKERLINISNLSIVVKIMNDICANGYTNKVDIDKKEIHNSYKFGNIFMINIANYISEMTDGYAVHEFEKLYLRNC